MLRVRFLVGLTLAVLLLVSAAAAATDWGSPVEAAFDTESEVREILPQESEPDPDDGPEANLPYLFAVFIITWAVFFGYVFVMSRRQNELRQEIDALKQRLAESESGAGPGTDQTGLE